MVRPTTKEELLRASDDGLQAVWDGAAELGEGARWDDPDDRDHSVRDVVGHLREWQRMMLGWYDDGMAGRAPVMPAPGHTWRTTPALNAEIWVRYQDTTELEVREGLAETHARLRAIIMSHTEDELFEKTRYPWTGSTSLGSYVVSATSSHYAWAATKLRRRRVAVA
ncbi:hypothetical protein SAMN05216410_2880 [Sanguibacter gelidistatuariae]|uniref:DinB superfamily protein n=1 Tax=Sanguibacter gelidistatuariae TaxID=1814289 RepID=A0A1G6S716_9MICO|nr:ClbS/DfsB family four-helix bundle protein [Sanguibacter gelidistatuariae]SDD11945.1 hypothetical protein SAMN05216410_2880 [Sanguibacter gelidistatuariae]